MIPKLLSLRLKIRKNAQAIFFIGEKRTGKFFYWGKLNAYTSAVSL